MKTQRLLLVWLVLLASIYSCKKSKEEPVNNPPFAKAGSDFAISFGQKAVLNGSTSSDPDGNTLTYAWQLITKPVGSQVAFVNAVTVTFEFTPDATGEYVAELSVSDGKNPAVKDQVKVTVNQLINNIPVSNPGLAQTVNVGAKVTLSGSASTDSDNDPLTYTWTFKSKPIGSTAVLTNADKVSAEFTPDLVGDYAVELSVSDGKSDPVKAEVKITANANNPNPSTGCRLTTSNGALFEGEANLEYNSAGNLVKYTLYTTYKTVFTLEYDASGKAIKMNFANEQGVLQGYMVFSYTNNRLTKADIYDIQQNLLGSDTYTHDSNGRVIAVGGSASIHTKFQYNANGNIIKEEHYKADGSLQTTITYENYDNKNNPAYAIVGYPLIGGASTNNPGKKTEVENTITTVSTYTYQYNNSGYPITITETVGGVATQHTATYTGCN